MEIPSSKTPLLPLWRGEGDGVAVAESVVQCFRMPWGARLTPRDMVMSCPNAGLNLRRPAGRHVGMDGHWQFAGVTSTRYRRRAGHGISGDAGALESEQRADPLCGLWRWRRRLARASPASRRADMRLSGHSGASQAGFVAPV